MEPKDPRLHHAFEEVTCEGPQGTFRQSVAELAGEVEDAVRGVGGDGGRDQRVEQRLLAGEMLVDGLL
jgi:hypothetical protein